VRVLLFARLKDLAGVSELACTIPTPISETEFRAWLFDQCPALRGHCDQVRLARNGVYLQENEKLEPDDEVALIPPVSGG